MHYDQVFDVLIPPRNKIPFNFIVSQSLNLWALRLKASDLTFDFDFWLDNRDKTSKGRVWVDFQANIFTILWNPKKEVFVSLWLSALYESLLQYSDILHENNCVLLLQVSLLVQTWVYGNLGHCNAPSWSSPWYCNLVFRQNVGWVVTGKLALSVHNGKLY